MALEEVIKGITEQAESENAVLAEEARQQAEKMVSDAKKKAQAMEKQANEKAAKLVEVMMRQEKSSLRLNLNKKKMKAKKEILEQTFDKAVEQIEKMPSAKRKAVLKKLVNKARKELPDAKFYYCNKKDKTAIKSIFSKAKFAGEINCLGGVILENGNKTIRVNQTFEVLLEEVKGEHLNEVSKRIFV